MMTDATKISTWMDDARECEQPDVMKEKTATTQELPQSSPENKVTEAAAATATLSVGDTTAPTCSTASVATSEDSNSSSRRPEEKTKKTEATIVNNRNNQDSLVLTQLARQLEYYFSSQNLAKDTYVQTLRQLNSGCVPVSILANFSKVKLLLSPGTTTKTTATTSLALLEEEERVHAVLQASTEHSEGRLRVVSIDTGSGKIVTDETPSGANTILAIGTHDNEPLTIGTTITSCTAISASPTAAVLPCSPLGSSTNTLILRDVIPQVTEQDIQALFTFEGCPTVESIRQDVGNCWFVRFDTDDRYVMAQTMLHVQTLTLAGYPVHARLKASLTSTVSVDTAPPMPATAWLPDVDEGGAMVAGTSKSSRKKKSRGRKNKKKSNNNNNSDISDKKDVVKDNKKSDSNNNKNKTISTTATSPKSPSVIPPSLDEDNFPTLQDKKVEWENISEQDCSSKGGDNADEDKDREDDDDDEEEEEEGDEEGFNHEGEEEQRRLSSSFSKATFSSDGASTATTTSSSTESFPKKTTHLFPMGGYAAALMTTPCPKRQQSAMSTTDKSKAQENRSITAAVNGGSSANVDEIAAATAAGGPPPMVVQPPTWGQGRSFAEILRKD